MKIIEDFEAAKAALSRQGPDKSAFEADERETTVRQIIDEVRRRGDAALLDFTRKFDGVELSSLEITPAQIQAAYEEVDDELLGAIETAAERVTAYHEAQRDKLLQDGGNGTTGWLMRPLRRAGVHVPGFAAPLPSTVLMTVIPAKVAGVKEVYITTPPGKQGTVSPLTLVAADIAGADRLFCVGGAQAVAALAFGTETVPAVDKVCGPGNIYVTLAKKLLYGVVGIDGLAGPSEVMIIADDGADPAFCAADLLAQAEHTSGTAVLVTLSKNLAETVIAETEKQLQELPRSSETAASLKERGLAAVVSDMDQAVTLANLYAPEHLLLLVQEAAAYPERITAAGCIVLGDKGTVALGDYSAGPSHVLPTGGTARFASPLNVLDFVKLTSVISVDETTLADIGPATRLLAEAEGLDAHARAVARRLIEG